MIGAFETCMPLLLDVEKGYWDDPAGGPTNLGVTLDAWRSWKTTPVSTAEIEALTPAEVEPFYRARYWDVVSGDDLPAGVDWLTFDGAVNQGPGRVARWLQLAAGVTPDGSVGPVTITAVKTQEPGGIISRLYNRRWLAYRQDPHFEDFGEGWHNRLDKVRDQALAMAAGLLVQP